MDKAVKNLKGEVLFDYFTKGYPDKNYSSIVALLPNAAGDLQKAFAWLERAVAENRKFVAIYPSIDNVDVSVMEYVGSIIDGGLFLK